MFHSNVLVEVVVDTFVVRFYDFTDHTLFSLNISATVGECDS